jgi:hypothetical protein
MERAADAPAAQSDALKQRLTEAGFAAEADHSAAKLADGPN